MKTSKLYLAAALISLGAGLDHVDKSDSKHMEFHLIFSSPISDEGEWFYRQTEAWKSRTLMVNAQGFVDAIQKLKEEVHKL